MPTYKRAFIPGGTFFFTLVTYQRRPIFTNSLSCSILGTCLRECKQRWPFEIEAIVLLPDHIHFIWSLPRGDISFQKRIGWIKKEFTKRLLETNTVKSANVSAGKLRERRCGVWQPRYWEHLITDEEDFEAHFDYIHYNPVKHGFVECPRSWPHSSFHRWVRQQVYPENWACSGDSLPEVASNDMTKTVGE